MVAQRYFVALGRHLPADDCRPHIKTALNGTSGEHRRYKFSAALVGLRVGMKWQAALTSYLSTFVEGVNMAESEVAARY